MKKNNLANTPEEVDLSAKLGELINENRKYPLSSLSLFYFLLLLRIYFTCILYYVMIKMDKY